MTGPQDRRHIPSTSLTKKRDILVLGGGISAEREVSLATTSAVHRALIERGHQARILDIPSGPEAGETLLRALLADRPDVVFIALHGCGGEDGRIQGVLEWLQIPYTGSGVEASAIAMNKARSRELFALSGIPCAEGCLWNGEALSELELPSGPWALKPPREGSSVGIQRVEGYGALTDALARSQSPLLIERWTEGTEVSVPVFLGEAWEPVEIDAAEGWYDYEAKYARGDTRYHLPARISEDARRSVMHFAAQIHRSFGCRGVTRSDFIIAPTGVITLEVNTLPGMTGSSLVPKAAASRGIDFPSLIERLLEDASLER